MNRTNPVRLQIPIYKILNQLPITNTGLGVSLAAILPGVDQVPDDISGLENKMALVTGASRGIGQAIALEFAKQGAFVAGTATTLEGAEKISEMFTKAGVKGQGFVLNVTDATSRENLFTELKKLEDFGSPDILVNNAGITRDNILLRMKEEEWDAVIATNLSSVFHLTQRCLKSMCKAKWGRIITISSIVGTTGNPGQANYAAAKAGIIGFTKALAQEYAARNLTANFSVAAQLGGLRNKAKKQSPLLPWLTAIDF